MASTTTRWIGRGLTVLAGLGVGCDEPDIPEHDVQLIVSCDEAVFQASFHFDDFTCSASSPGLFSGGSDTTVEGQWTGGDDFVFRALLTGNGAETAMYLFYLDERFEQPEPWPQDHRTPLCQFHRHDGLGVDLPCWHEGDCTGRLTELDE